MDLYDRLTHDRIECFSHLLGTVGIFLPKEIFGIERIAGRKATGLQTKEIGCKCQTSIFSLLGGRKKQTSVTLFPLLYTNLKRGFS